MGRVRYAVRRSRRRRRNSAGLQKALSCLLAAGYVASAVLLGVMISGKWLLPLARGGQEGQEAAEDAQPAESPSLLSALSQEEPQAELLRSFLPFRLLRWRLVPLTAWRKPMRRPWP